MYTYVFTYKYTCYVHKYVANMDAYTCMVLYVHHACIMRMRAYICRRQAYVYAYARVYA